MADILIRMEMPKYTTKAEFGIDADGNPLCMVYHENGTEPDIYDVVPLPEGHGRLGDLDRLFEVMGQDADRWIVDEVSMIETDDVLDAIQNAPTIVPAEGGEADGN